MAAGAALDNALAEALRRAHDVGRVHGLVRGDHDELFHAGFFGNIHDIQGAEDVVAHGLDAVPLHEGNVLVGRGVEHNLGMMAVEDGLELRPVGNGDDFRHDGEILAIGDFQLLFDIIGAVFIHIEHDELRGLHAGDLAAEFGADGATAAGDQDGFAGIVFPGFRGKEILRPAEEQFLHVELAHGAAGAVLGVGQGIIIDFHAAAELPIAGIEFPGPVGIHAGQGEDHLLDREAGQHFLADLIFVKNLETADPAADFFGIVVDEKDGKIGAARIGQELIRQGRADPAGADDGDIRFLGDVALLRLARADADAGQVFNDIPKHIADAAVPGFQLIQILPNQAGAHRQEQIAGEEGHGAHEGHFVERQEMLEGVMGEEGQGVREDQADEGRGVRVMPDLAVDPQEEAETEDRYD